MEEISASSGIVGDYPTVSASSADISVLTTKKMEDYINSWTSLTDDQKEWVRLEYSQIEVGQVSPRFEFMTKEFKDEVCSKFIEKFWFEDWDALTDEQKAWTKERFGKNGVLIKFSHIINVWDERVSFDTKDIQTAQAECFVGDYNNDSLHIPFVRAGIKGSTDETPLSNGFCPHCNNVGVRTLIHPNAGKFPSFIVLLMGTRDAGKTVFFTIASDVMKDSRYKDSKLQCQVTYDYSVEYPTTKSDSRTIKQHLDSLQSDGKLPITTTDPKPPPICFESKVIHSGHTHTSLIYLRDVPGEMLASNESDLLMLARNFEKFDGVLLLMDPLSLSNAGEIFDNALKKQYNKLSQNDEQIRDDMKRRFQKSQKSLSDLSINLSVRFCPGEIIRKPTILIISKGDMFRDDESIAILESKGIKQANLAVTKIRYNENFADSNCLERPSQPNSGYYDGISIDTKAILDKLGTSYHQNILAKFDDSVVKYFLASALGDGVNVKADGVGENAGHYLDRDYEHIRSDKVIESMEYLLMSLGVLPPFHKTRSNNLTSSKPKSSWLPFLKSKNAPKGEQNNSALLNEWKENYTVGWEAVKF